MDADEHTSLNQKELRAFVVDLTDCINSFYVVINLLLIDTVSTSEQDDIQFNSYIALGG